MKISAIKVYEVKIPFAFTFDHALKKRKHTESLIIEILSSEGQYGYGEGTPRSYVNNEVPSVVKAQCQSSFPFLINRDFNSLQEVIQLKEIVKRALPYPSIICAFEMALLDLLGKQLEVPLSVFLNGKEQKLINYSAILPFGQDEKLRSILQRIKAFAFKEIKVKVGNDNDLTTLNKVRETLGQEIDIRLDANQSWKYGEALSIIPKLEQFNISSIEEPLHANEYLKLGKLASEINVPIMLDENLCSFAQAIQWSEMVAHEFLLFNLKLSKIGGLINAAKIHQFASSKGILCQLGCNVGETAILSAAGRHFAQKHVLKNLEGSYGPQLLKDDISDEPFTFDRRGRSKPLSSPGLGISVDRSKLNRYGRVIASSYSKVQSFLI